MISDFSAYGADGRFIALAAEYPALYLGRVASQSRNLYKVVTKQGELLAEVSGKFRYEANAVSAYPVVGDFVMLDRDKQETGNAMIQHVLPRKSKFERKAAGSANETQIVSANIDTVFLCMSLNDDFNLRRLERYLSIAWDSGAIPVIVLTKSDLCETLQAVLCEVERISLGADVVVTSSMEDSGWQAVLPYLAAGKTVAFIGSSGVGKSTLINRLLGETRMETKDIRGDDKGRHTTTRRELILLPGGGIVIDTPGMREIGVIGADLSKSFPDIATLAAACKFNDCTHTEEPGCAIRQALANGTLGAERFASYQKIQKEAKYDGMNSREIENAKITEMFAGMGGFKNAQRYIKEKNVKRNREK